ncbi:polyketide cyclase / dehydrase and lipid transport [Mycolicibacterium celeriflavum]|nr:polyketide cyclase / dehydrase and lipid transport [Mycolicibacterium celeriflavum]MCV7238839.1 SRPBCC family protein [Mycolicibacterium celeriflavum]OBG24488.1 polyketide cyclase / dehydrase and lipid transport [Mycolicibacterium celeriflavum]ORA46248.1 polyketide cyclase / dehydrase and lipid transport [Mycolicibacterium celeriflavum]
MTCAHRVLTEEVCAPPADVRAFYVDLDNIATVHPLVVAVRATARIPVEQGYRQSYRVTDRIRMGPVTLRTTYRARLTVPVTGDVTAEAQQFPGVRLRALVGFDSTSCGTRVTERICIEAPRPLAPFVTREAVKAHREMLLGIRRRFER